MKGQINLLDEIIVDNFAGGGGASTGIELAAGRPVTIAINHDPDAIAMHRANHPYTKHYCESVWDINPREVCAGRKVGLAWFSPDCKHFSKAKGCKPVEKKIRGLAWIVLKWAGTVKPRVIILENVEEFQTWGPVRKGRPVKSQAGQTFTKWKSQLESLGYAIEHRELIAADYGAPTIRKRFFLIARCDGKPIVWPESTHAPKGSTEVIQGQKIPWRSAAEIIDWSLPCPSIFDTKSEIKAKYSQSAVRPLADNTMRRVARGLDKFVLKSGKPFIVQTNHGGDGFRGQDMAEPTQTITGKHGYGVCAPQLEPWTVTNVTNATGHPVSEPVDTVRTGGGGGQMMIIPAMTAIGQTGFSEDRSYSPNEPVRTIVSKAEQCLIAPSLIQYHTEQTENVRGQQIGEPIMTIDAAPRYGLSSAFLSEWYGNAADGINMTDPMRTQTAKDREALTMAHICKFKGQNIGQPPEYPLQTITTSAGEFAAVHTKVVRYTPGTCLGHWAKIREILNQYCGYTLADNEIILMHIFGVWYFISDIGLRMLTPRELYAANGFPPDYIIEHDADGKVYGKTKQVARCGNAVPPPFAEALVRANMPEWCVTKIRTMKEFEEVVAV